MWRKPLRRVLSLLLVIVFIVAFCYFAWQGKWLGIIGWILTVFLLIDHGARILFDVYGQDHHWATGIIFWIASIFMGILGIQIVTRDGQIRRIRPSGPLATVFARMGAKGLIIIENGAAVVLEQSGRNTAVQGPGLYWTRRFEFIAQVVPLQPRLTERDVLGIQTVDGLSLSIRPVTVVYRVAQNFDPATGKYVFNPADVLNLFYMGGHLYTAKQGAGPTKQGSSTEEETQEPAAQRLVMPDERIHRLVEQGLRNSLAARSLTHILTGVAGSTRLEIVHATLLAAAAPAAALGVQITAIELGRIEVSPEYKQFRAALVQRSIIQTISIGLHDALKAMLPTGVTLGDALQRTDPQIRAMLATMVEQVLYRVVPLPPIADEPEKGSEQSSGGTPTTGAGAHTPGSKWGPV